MSMNLLFSKVEFYSYDSSIELGIDFSHILNKILVVINPRKRIDSVLVNDADLTGPILFCFILSVFMLLVSVFELS
jgi:protein YIPF7